MARKTRRSRSRSAKTAGGGNRAWGGRFAEATASDAQAFTASIGFDLRLYPYDVRVSVAHARMLAASKIISASDRDRIVAGLRAVERELASGKFRPTAADEDVHMAIERRLVEKIGEVGAKLHAGRSRNDQVVTDVRLFLKDAVARVRTGIAELRGVLLRQARRRGHAILPGYTHLQRAQPILLGHHLLAYFDMLGRDDERLADALDRIDVLPLGAGALAGTTLPIDPKRVAKELGFGRVADNSMDAVSDRDFIVEFLAAVAILFAHLSRLANDITLWVSSEFGFARLSDAYSSGSSMMPQKKNPDIAELVRGKSGRVYGNLVSLLTTLKGLPLAYNSDLQEDKEALFDSVDTACGSLHALGALVGSLEFDETRMGAAAADSFLLATDLAEYMVAAGIPFRQAHATVGRIVRDCLDTERTLADLSAEELASYSAVLGREATSLLTAERAVDRRRSIGGTAGANLDKRLRTLARGGRRRRTR